MILLRRRRRHVSATTVHALTVTSARVMRFEVPRRVSVAGEDLKLATLRLGEDQQWVVGSRKHLRWLPLCFAHGRRYADLHAPVLELGVESVRVEKEHGLNARTAARYPETRRALMGRRLERGSNPAGHSG